MGLTAKVLQEAARQPLQQGDHARPVDLLAQSAGRRLLEVVRLVDDQVVILGQQAAAYPRIRKQERVIDHHQVGGLRLGAGAVDVAVLLGAVDAHAVEGVAGHVRPPDLLPAVQAELGAVAALRGVEPGEELELKHQLLGVPARLDQIPPPAPERDVVRPAFQKAGFEVPGQPLAQAGQVLAHELLLQRVGVGGDDDALAVADRPRQGWDQVGEALPRPGAGLDHQHSSAGLDLGHGEQHLQLRLAVLVAGQQVGQRSLWAEQAGERCGVLGRPLRRASAARRLDADGGSRLGVRVGGGQGLGEKERHRPGVRCDQSQHRLLEPFVQGQRLLAQAEQELAGGVGVVQRPVRPGLAEPHLGRQQRQAVAARGREQDAGDVQGVKDLDRPVPQAGGLEKLDVQAGAMADGLAAA